MKKTDDSVTGKASTETSTSPAPAIAIAAAVLGMSIGIAPDRTLAVASAVAAENAAPPGADQIKQRPGAIQDKYRQVGDSKALPASQLKQGKESLPAVQDKTRVQPEAVQGKVRPDASQLKTTKPGAQAIKIEKGSDSINK